MSSSSTSTGRSGDDLLLDLRGIGLEVQRPRRVRVLHPMDVAVAAGTSLAVVGPSGAGKSTLASIVGGLQPATEGSYRFDGAELVGLSPGKIARFRNDNVGFVFQLAHLIDERSAWRNVALGITDPTVSRRDVESQSREALELVGLGALADREAAPLSGGERQRVAIARAMVKHPRLVIADEPTGALDQATGLAVLELLYSLTTTGTTLVVVTHDERAATMADARVRIVDGKTA